MLVWCCNNYSQYKKLKIGKHYKRLKCDSKKVEHRELKKKKKKYPF